MVKDVWHVLLPQAWGGCTSSLWGAVGFCHRLRLFREIWRVPIFSGLCPDAPVPCVRDAGFPKCASDVGMADMPWLNVQASLNVLEVQPLQSKPGFGLRPLPGMGTTL